MPEQPEPQQLQEQLAKQFDPTTDDRPDAIGPEDVDDNGEVIKR